MPYQTWETASYKRITRNHRRVGLTRRIFDRVLEFRAQQDNEQWHLLRTTRWSHGCAESSRRIRPQLPRSSKVSLTYRAETYVYVCICHTVTEADVDRAIAGGAHCEVSVGEATGAGTGCGSCVDRVCDLLQRAVPGHGKMPLKVAV